MATLKQCPNGHYFDPGLYPSCPYCSGVSTSIDRSVNSSFTAQVSDYNFATTNPDNGGGTMPAYDEQGFSGSTNFETVPTYTGTNGAFGNIEPTRPPVEDYSGVTKPVQPSVKGGSRASEIEPQRYTVGWLVAVEGPYAGKSFEIHHGYTHIGRDKGDIVLPKDSFVSSEKHVSAVYSEKNNRFFLNAGQSTNLVYVNGDELLSGSHVELKAYDDIELGESKFLFIPFCSDKFKW